MNWYRNIDRTKVQFDFLLRSRENIYEEEIEKLGGKVFYTSSFPRHFIKNRKQTIAFFKEHGNEYACVHVHGNALLYVSPLKIAKKYGVPIRVMHSHSTKTKKKIYKLMHKKNKAFVKKYATDLLACSEAAGKFAFGDADFTVIANGIDTGHFVFSEKVRNDKRKELGIENSFVIGHVGRLLPNKNQSFLVEVLKEVLAFKENAVLLLIGTGPTEEEVKRKAEDLGVADKVIFAGVRRDVNELYSAMDVFAFPSTYEGFPLVPVEAQCAGLKCLLSDTITTGANVSGEVDFLPAGDAALWADKIAAANTERYDCIEKVKKAGLDIAESAAKLQAFYSGEKI